jgi:hypothetical protein
MVASLATAAAGLASILLALVILRHGTTSWKVLDLLGIILTFLGFASGECHNLAAPKAKQRAEDWMRLAMSIRAWLLPLISSAIIVVGVSFAVTSRLGGLVFSAGIVAAVAGVLGILALCLDRNRVR